LRNLVAEAEPGSTAKVGLLRDGKASEVSVDLGERPKNIVDASGSKSGPESSTSERFGLSVQDITSEIARALGFGDDHGVVVVEVKTLSIAESAGLQKNDLIKEVNRNQVHTVSEFNQAMKRVGKDNSVALLVRRGNNTFFVALQLAS
jgi:serine protease Do